MPFDEMPCDSGLFRESIVSDKKLNSEPKRLKFGNKPKPIVLMPAVLMKSRLLLFIIFD